MNIEFPIKFKYYTISPGRVEPETTTENGFAGYRMEDLNGAYVSGSRNLAALVLYAASRDIAAEEAQQFLTRKLPGLEHLDGVDIDRRPDPNVGLMMPAHMTGGTAQGGGNGGLSH